MKSNKNIHILATDKPSKLWIDNDSSQLIYGLLSVDNIHNCKNKNIYITSNKSPDMNGYYLLNDNVICKKDETYFATSWKEREIILTTDQDLIKDGVQAIDDEFLEWFVKNPSCENVEVKKEETFGRSGPLDKLGFTIVKYKIIIPKEEQKQHLIDMMKSDEELGLYDEPKQEGYICPHTKIQCDDECCVSAEDCHITSSLATGMVDCDEPKQETLEEAAEKYGISVGCDNGTAGVDFIAGVKWQQERSYSEEDMRNAFDSAREFNSLDGVVDVHIVLPMGRDMSDLQPLHFTFKEWLEKFKKK